MHPQGQNAGFYGALAKIHRTGRFSRQRVTAGDCVGQQACWRGWQGLYSYARARKVLAFEFFRIEKLFSVPIRARERCKGKRKAHQRGPVGCFSLRNETLLRLDERS